MELSISIATNLDSFGSDATASWAQKMIQRLTDAVLAGDYGDVRVTVRLVPETLSCNNQSFADDGEMIYRGDEIETYAPEALSAAYDQAMSRLNRAWRTGC